LKIGLSQRILYHRGRAYDATEHGWYSYLKDHTLTYVPNTLEQDFVELADSLDAFIITGGDDSTLRRTVELKLATVVMQRNKPVIGVCHGSFLLTDLLGGLVTDVQDHHSMEHSVEYFGEVHMVNSYHDLCIKKLHQTGTALCYDNGQNVEAWIDGTLAGVVWHPERMNQPWLPDEIEHLLFKEKK
jgi:gamma-glutamyl-gamma-aminobutyrate hydrolase PuuD